MIFLFLDFAQLISPDNDLANSPEGAIRYVFNPRTHVISRPTIPLDLSPSLLRDTIRDFFKCLEPIQVMLTPTLSTTLDLTWFFF